MLDRERLGHRRLRAAMVAVALVFATACRGTLEVPSAPTAVTGCALTITPSSQSTPASGGEYATTVTGACGWRAEADAAWIVVTHAEGAGAGAITYTVQANPGASAREGRVRIGGEVLVVTQAGFGCTFAVEPASHRIAASGGSGEFRVSTDARCAWSASVSDGWVTVGTASGTGPQTVGFTVQPNTGASERGAQIRVGDQVVAVQQAAPLVPPGACSFGVSPTSVSALSSGGAFSTTVTTSSACAWTASSNASFVTISSAPAGIGSGTVTFSVAPNAGGARSGTLTVAGQIVTVNQSGVGTPACQVAVSPTSVAVGASGGGASVTVTVTQGTGCSWTAASNAAFISVSSGASGTGNGAVTFTVGANSGGARSGTLTVAGQAVTANQAASAVIYTLSAGLDVQPWCNSSFAFQTSPALGFGSPTAPGPNTHTDRPVSGGTSVQLSGSGAGTITSWSGCDSVSGGTCTVTMNANRSVRARVAESCATPAFSVVSKSLVGGNWVISFTAINLLPFGPSTIYQETFAASCPGFSTTLQLSSQASGTVSGTITVPASNCSGGTLTVSDFNGQGAAPW